MSRIPEVLFFVLAGILVVIAFARAKPVVVQLSTLPPTETNGGSAGQADLRPDFSHLSEGTYKAAPHKRTDNNGSLAIVQPYWTSDMPIRTALTVVFGGCALVIILGTRFKPQDKHWAYGTAGMLIGYWFGI